MPNRDFGPVNNLARQLKLLVAPVLALALITACAKSTAFEPLADGPCTANQEAAITKHLSAQIDALAARNWELAYSYASANFRFTIPLAQFTEIIQADYGMLIENNGYSFCPCEISGYNIMLQVNVASDQGEFSLAYKLSFYDSKIGVESALIKQLTDGLSL